MRKLNRNTFYFEFALIKFIWQIYYYYYWHKLMINAPLQGINKLVKKQQEKSN